MFGVSIFMFIIVTLMSALRIEMLKDLLKTNLTFYIMLMISTFSLQQLVKNTFNLGMFKYTDEVKMEMLMGIKAFTIVFMTLKSIDTNTIFDYDLKALHLKLNMNVNLALAPFWFKPKEIPFDFTVFVFSFVAALISFSVVRI
jgi:hypothetical protein